MSLIEDLNEEYELEEGNVLVERVKNQILNVKKFIKELKIGQYYIVYIDFGEKLTQKYENNKLLSRNQNDTFSIKKMFEVRGYNCGFNEFRYTHMAVILNSIHHKYLLNKRDKHYSLLVAPISSNNKRTIHSMKLDMKYYPWLENESFILLDKITHISFEKINIKQTKQIYRKNKNIPIQLTSEDTANFKENIKIIFDI